MSGTNAKYVTQFSSKAPQALTRVTTRAVSTNAEYVAERPLPSRDDVLNVATASIDCCHLSFLFMVTHLE